MEEETGGEEAFLNLQPVTLSPRVPTHLYFVKYIIAQNRVVEHSFPLTLTGLILAKAPSLRKHFGLDLLFHFHAVEPFHRVTSQAKCLNSGPMSFSQANFTAAGEPGVETTILSR